MTRNREIFEDVLSGQSFRQIATKYQLSTVRARRIFMREFKKTSPVLYQQGVDACPYRAVTPQISWCMSHADYLLTLPPVADPPPKPTNADKAITLLEGLGYRITAPAIPTASASEGAPHGD
jgi:hypothetical protein